MFDTFTSTRSDVNSNVTPFDLMTDEELKEYIEDEEADVVLSSFEWQEQDYLDCALPA